MAKRPKPREWYNKYNNSWDNDYQTRLDYERKLAQMKELQRQNEQLMHGHYYNNAYATNSNLTFTSAQYIPVPNGLTPTAYQINNPGIGPMTISAEYVMTDPAALQQAALPPAKAKPESPLQWLDRRVAEVCKVGTIK